MPPVARLGDKCVSPSGKSGTITTGSDVYFVEDRPAARIGDTVTYVDGSTTVIAEGDPGLDVMGRGAARLGYRLADGGRIVQGASSVTSDDPYPGAGSVAEQVMVGARRGGQAFVSPACVLRAHEEAAADEPDLDDATVTSGPQLLLDRDLADGGRSELHGAGRVAAEPTA